MKTVSMTCSQCFTPVNLPRKTARAWAEKAGTPFVCDPCLAQQIKRAVAVSDVAKAEADTRAFLIVNQNPTTHENPNHRTQQPRP